MTMKWQWGFIFTFILFGPAEVYSVKVKCTNSQVGNCLKDMNILNLKDTTKMCASLFGMVDCVDKLKTQCELGDAKQKSVDRSMEQINNLKATCNREVTEEKGCPSSTANKCLQPLEELNDKDGKDTTAYCRTTHTAALCLRKAVSACDNEDSKKQLRSSIGGLVKQGEQYECKEKGYDIKKSGNKGVVLQPLIAVVLAAFLMVLLGPQL